MPQAFSTPGIYRKETDLSNVVKPVGTSIGAMVGRANQGPVNQRILINTNKQFVQTFGAPTTSADFAHYGAMQFLNESANLWMVRCTYGDEKYANATFPVGIATATSASQISSTNVSAISSTAGLTGVWADGYTLKTQDGDPGINDIESFGSFGTGLNIASIGPGTYGNNIGIAIITCASSLSGTSYPYGFNWQNKYDTTPTLTSANSAAMIWPQVYRVNVYVKDANADTATVWAGGVSGTTSVESFLVSNNRIKDATGNSLFAPFVINGSSNYIYIKKANISSSYPADTTAVGIVALSNGGNSSTATTGQKLAAAQALYSDKTKVTIDMLITPDVVTTSDASYIQGIGNIAATRMDCIAVTQCSSLTATSRATINSELANFSFSGPSYVAPYVGYDKIYDTYTDSEVFIPKAIAGAVIMARTDRVANTWDAPAGVNRGIIGYSIGQNTVLSEADIGAIYDNNANTSKFINGYGNVLWGQKTAQKKATALDRINVRRLLLYIENTIEPSLLPFLYEENTSRTRSRLSGIIDSFLSKVKAGGGLYDYKVVCDLTNNTADDIDLNLLNADIYVQPTKTIEFIQLQTIITRTGSSFNEVV